MVSSGLVPVAVFVALLHAIQTAQPVSGCQPPTCYRDENGGEVACTQCPVGYGVRVVDKQLISCQSAPYPRDTQCDPCTAGVNYSDVHDAETSCRTCVPCQGEKEETLENCTAEHKTDCQCIPGYYFNIEFEACFRCRACTDDEGEVQACLPSQNRECEKLPTSTLTPSTLTPSEPVDTPNATTVKLTPPKKVEVPIEPPTPSHVKGSEGVNKIGVIIGCIFAVLIIVICVIWKTKPEWFCSPCQRCRNGNADHPAGTARQESNSIVVWNCCTFMNKQTNVAGNATMNGHAMANGTGPYAAVHQNGHDTRQLSHISNGSISNGGTRTDAELELLNPTREDPTAPPEEFNSDEQSYIIAELTVDDALKLAEGKLDVHGQQLEHWRSQGSAVVYLLDMWAEKGHTRAEFVAALQLIERGALAERLSND